MLSRRNLTIGALALLLAAAPFVPRGHHHPARIEPSGTTAGHTGALGAITPAMQAEIDRVVAAGLSSPRLRAKPDAASLVSTQARCAVFEGLTYCLHVGWTEESPTQVQRRITVASRMALARSATASDSTGDLDITAELERSARMRPATRAAADRTELSAAARSVAKVWVLRHELEGVPYPTGFWARHPEAAAFTHQARAKARATSAPTKSASASQSPTKSATATASTSPSTSPSGSPSSSATPKTAGDYPQRAEILDPTRVAEQTTTYWCGPTSMQMIGWGWSQVRRTQARWARRLGTTSHGTGIDAMVATVNRYTGWDGKDYAGPYVVLDVGKFSYRRWKLLIMRHITDYRAPIVMHPILLKRFFPYLDDDGSGHYQVGRGYAQRGDKPDLVSYFEPWNQQRFDPSEPFIDRVQWHRAYRAYRANLAHPLHNIGV